MNTQQIVKTACSKFNHDAGRMLDILWDVQDHLGWISPDAMKLIADLTNTFRVEVEGVVTFYAFFRTEPQGRHTIYLCEDIIDRHAGMEAVREALEQAMHLKAGETSTDGLFSLHMTPCIGMCDQAPAALVNNEVITKLTPTKAKRLVSTLRKNGDIKSLIKSFGDGQNAHPLVQSVVSNNIRQTGPVLLEGEEKNLGLIKALQSRPADILQTVIDSNMRGRGGAGFTSGIKWKMAATTISTERYVICNADEGEPGTFKDRVLLTERAHLLFEGMTIAGYAIGSEHGILYLRAEYRYLLPYLESVLASRRSDGLLGEDILIDESEHQRFSFDIRIQLGAGAYICGEESSLISSCEGKRGEPKNKPPFPAQVGYLGKPTIVNNVETFCCVPRIIEHGADWFKGIGTKESAGTKLLSVAGDCDHPGVYELPMGVTLREVLKMAGAHDTAAVQVGGASGVMVGLNDFDRRLCFEDLPTAGAIMVFASHRNILEIVDYFMYFFIEESCGYCTPCRVGNVFMKKALEKIMNGLGEKKDLEYIQQLGKTVIQTSRCGLGHTSPNPLLSTIKNFPLVYAALLKDYPDGSQVGFNIHHALDEARIIAKRRSIVYDPELGGTDS